MIRQPSLGGATLLVVVGMASSAAFAGQPVVKVSERFVRLGPAAALSSDGRIKIQVLGYDAEGGAVESLCQKLPPPGANAEGPTLFRWHPSTKKNGRFLCPALAAAGPGQGVVPTVMVAVAAKDEARGEIQLSISLDGARERWTPKALATTVEVLTRDITVDEQAAEPLLLIADERVGPPVLLPGTTVALSPPPGWTVTPIANGLRFTDEALSVIVHAVPRPPFSPDAPAEAFRPFLEAGDRLVAAYATPQMLLARVERTRWVVDFALVPLAQQPDVWMSVAIVPLKTAPDYSAHNLVSVFIATSRGVSDLSQLLAPLRTAGAMVPAVSSSRAPEHEKLVTAWRAALSDRSVSWKGEDAQFYRHAQPRESSYFEGNVKRSATFCSDGRFATHYFYESVIRVLDFTRVKEEREDFVGEWAVFELGGAAYLVLVHSGRVDLVPLPTHPEAPITIGKVAFPVTALQPGADCR